MKNIRVLVVEDSEDDALIDIMCLRDGGFAPEFLRVDNRTALQQALRDGAWDVILCDDRMPEFSGMEALRTVQESGKDIPFIVISGTIGEETAVGMMKAGAHDYLLKDAMERLVPAVERELRDAELRRERRNAEAVLRDRERQLAESQRIAHIGSWEHNLRTGSASWSDELFRLLGLDPTKDAADFNVFFARVHPDDRGTLRTLIDRTLAERVPFNIEYRFVLPDGAVRTIHARAELRPDAAGDLVVLSGTAQDITERKRAEAAAAERGALLQQIMDTANVGLAFVDMEGRFTLVNRHMADLFGSTEKEMISGMYADYVHPSERETARQSMLGMLRSEVQSVELDRRYQREDGTEFWGHLTCNRFYDTRGGSLGLIGTISDVTERKHAEDARRESEERFRSIFANAMDGMLILDAEKGSFVEANDRICDMMGYAREELLGLGVDDIHPEQDLPHVHAVLDSQLRGEVSLAEDIPVRRKDGSVFFADINASTMTMNGRSCLLGIFRDITERKEADAALREREGQLAESQRIAHIGGWEHNLKTGAASWSDELFRLLGLDPKKDAADFRQFFDRVHPEDTPLLKGSIDRTLRERTPFSIEYRLVLGDGSVRNIHARAELQPDGAGEPVILRGTAQDITEHKRAEQALAESETAYRNLFESSADGIFILDLDGNILDANRTAYERLGYTREELLSLDVSKVNHPDFAARVPERLREMREKGRAVFETGHLRKDGSLLHVEVNGRLLEHRGRPVYFSIVRDITERKRAEEKIRQSEQRLKILIEAIPDAVFFKDMGGRHIIANKANEDIYGLSPEAMIGKTVEDLLPPELAAVCRANDEDVMRRREPVRSEERSADSAGNEHILDTLKVPLYAEDGSAIGLVGIARDITERKHAEEKIRQSEEFVRNILDSVDEGFIVVDRQYRIVTSNKAYCEQVGLPCNKVIGSQCFSISHRAMRPCYEEGEDCAVRHVFATGEPHAALHKHQDSEGQVTYVETKAFPIRDANGNVTSAIETINNITERHLLEEERLKTQKLESIGTLAGGIAHDFNNLLQGVFGYISMAKHTAKDPARCAASLDEAEKALHLAVKLTNQLLTFSKGGRPVKKPTDLRQLITASVRFALSGSRSASVFEADDGLWPAEVDDGQISQVVQNIVLNADQAMPLGGTVRIAARNVEAPGSEVPPQLPAGKYVKIVISDTGIGIPEQYLAKIFDPYFTTKEKGSGLGLATAYSIVRNHGGALEVRSEVGKGSTFLVYLPAAPPAASTGTPPQVLQSNRRGRVLLMDDEEMILTVTGELLGGLGHEVEFAREGEEAIDKFRAARDAGKPFDVVILDLTVRGGMGGAEAAGRLREIDPSVPMIVSSGYSDDAIIAEYREHGFSAFLKKPYDLQTLSEVLGALLR